MSVTDRDVCLGFGTPSLARFYDTRVKFLINSVPVTDSAPSGDHVISSTIAAWIRLAVL